MNGCSCMAKHGFMHKDCADVKHCQELEFRLYSAREAARQRAWEDELQRKDPEGFKKYKREELLWKIGFGILILGMGIGGAMFLEWALTVP